MNKEDSINGVTLTSFGASPIAKVATFPRCLSVPLWTVDPSGKDTPGNGVTFPSRSPSMTHPEGEKAINGGKQWDDCFLPIF